MVLYRNIMYKLRKYALTSDVLSRQKYRYVYKLLFFYNYIYTFTKKRK